MSSFVRLLSFTTLWAATPIDSSFAINKLYRCNASENCFVICDTPSSCFSSSIYLDSNSSLHLQCTDALSCSSLSINASSNTRTHISCLSASSCFNVTYHSAESMNSSVSMQCHSDYDSSDNNRDAVPPINGVNEKKGFKGSKPMNVPSADPTVDSVWIPYPIYDDDIDPISDRTSNTVSNPTSDPTSDRTSNPTSNTASNPSSDPSSDPTSDPTADPTSDPTVDPVLEQSIPTSDAMEHGIVPQPISPISDEVDTGDPTMEFEPTFEPTAVPLALFAFLKQETDGTLESSTNLVLIAVFGAAFMTVLSAMVFMKAIKESESRMMVDDQDLLSVVLYVLQIVDIFSDLVFALQCRVYWEYALTDDDDQVEPDDFMWLWRFALSFVLIPYGGNLLSSIKMTHAIAQDDHISSHSKRYFRERSILFTVLVLLSGGSFRALKLMNSNLFGLPLFSAGLSTLQIQQFQHHHVWATVFAENVPQIALQYYFMFELGLPTIPAIASFCSSIFNILMSVMAVMVFRILHRDSTEMSFTILLSWNRKDSNVITRAPTFDDREDHKDLNPFYRCGRRRALAKSLGEIIGVDDVEAGKIEILSSARRDGGCLLHGVLVTDNSVAELVRRTDSYSRGRNRSYSMSMSFTSTMSEFLSQRTKIQKAVIKAFGLGRDYRTFWSFTVTVSESAQTTRAERVKLILNGLKELKLSKKTMAAVKQEIGGMEEDEAQYPEHQLLLPYNESNDDFAEEISREMIV